MRRAAIVSPLRTPVGKFGGALASVPVEDLGATVVRAVVERSGIEPSRIEDVVFAQSYANSEVPCVGRWVALHAGLPIEVPGLQIDRRCGGGLQALITAAMMVQTGAADAVLAGGVESMSRIEHYSLDVRWGRRSGPSVLHDRLDRGRERSQPEWRFGYISGAVQTAENVALEYGIGREDADLLSIESHQRADAAWNSGAFTDEVVTVMHPRDPGLPLLVRDEGVRAGTSLDALAALKPVLKGGTVTAGNSSQQNDAASACLVVAEDKLDELGLEPLGFLSHWTAVGCDPAQMGIGPVPAVRKLFDKTNLSFDDIDLIELNEAFACQALAVLKGWGMDSRERVNVNGSGISIGHPIGATGMRMTTTLLHEMARREAKRGLVTMCVGGGQGVAALFDGV